MADYYTQAVIKGAYYLTPDQAEILKARGAELYETGEERTVLDSMTDGSAPSREYSIAFEEGYREYPETFEEWLEDYADDEDPDHYSDYFKKLFELPEERLFLEILKNNPGAVEIQKEEAHTCSKMREDGFGGGSLVVTRKGYLWIYSGSFDVYEDGTIKVRAEFVEWDDE